MLKESAILKLPKVIEEVSPEKARGGRKKAAEKKEEKKEEVQNKEPEVLFTENDALNAIE